METPDFEHGRVYLKQVGAERVKPSLHVDAFWRNYTADDFGEICDKRDYRELYSFSDTTQSVQLEQYLYLFIYRDIPYFWHYFFNFVRFRLVICAVSRENQHCGICVMYRPRSAWTVQADLGRHLTQIQQCWFSRGRAHMWEHVTIPPFPTAEKIAQRVQRKR